MLFHRHPLKDQSLESLTSDVSGTSCCNNSNRCGCDCQVRPGPRGCTGQLLGPEVVPDRLVLSGPGHLRENLVYRDIQGQSELLVLLVQ